jgi:transcriptional regulator with PAS, ATPase and Fis domain
VSYIIVEYCGYYFTSCGIERDIHLLFRNLLLILHKYKMPPKLDENAVIEKIRWSGNIRQLRNVKQISVLETIRDITANYNHLPEQGSNRQSLKTKKVK